MTFLEIAVLASFLKYHVFANLNFIVVWRNKIINFPLNFSRGHRVIVLHEILNFSLGYLILVIYPCVLFFFFFNLIKIWFLYGFKLVYRFILFMNIL